jgi:hypothetical protein
MSLELRTRSYKSTDDNDQYVSDLQKHYAFVIESHSQLVRMAVKRWWLEVHCPDKVVEYTDKLQGLISNTCSTRLQRQLPFD